MTRRKEHWRHVSCEVYNATYEPLTIVSGRRAVVLVMKGKAMSISEHADCFITANGMSYPVPSRIVLKKMVNAKSVMNIPAKLTPRNLSIRDKYRCAYCGRHKSELKHHEYFTRDHVIPQSRGGKDEWLNVVNACNKCNNKKANYFVEDSGLTLLFEPHIPTAFEIWSKSNKIRHAPLDI